MLRAILLYLSHARWARSLVSGWGAAWRVASRFVAGETLEEAVSLVKDLNGRGFYTTLDHLGEYTSTAAEAIHSTDQAIEILEAIEREALQSGISIKLSQIGMSIDEALCEKNLRRILKAAEARGLFVRIDMEDFSFLDRTMALYRSVRRQFGIDTVGLVLQSYLYRSLKDAADVTQDGTRIRLVKGAYKEPGDVAFQRKAEVDQEYDRITDELVRSALAYGAAEVSLNGRLPPLLALGTHDDRRVIHAKEEARKRGLPQQALEFQMLNGIRRDLQQGLLAEGFPVRIYVPFGREWYPYMVRRLAERPANLWFFLSNLIRR